MILFLILLILILIVYIFRNSQIKSNLDRSKIIKHAIKANKITDEQISMAVYSVCMESFKDKNSDNQQIIDASYNFVDYASNCIACEDVKKLEDNNCYVKSDVEILKENLSNVNSVNIGKNLEAKFRHVLSMCISNKLHPKDFYYRDVVGVDKYDKYAGTDFMLCGKNFEIRIDITARNCKHKDNTTLIKKYDYFDLGIRCGNLVKQFDEKVLVYSIPYDNEEFIIKGMIDIYNNFEDTIKLYLSKL